ncbi:3-hydroxyacyl-CoA dehydrogenase NAD-binding domain-containing protein [Sporolactobacillus sp. Y61]|uniref:3-hydroxyacyl-CoA dehydrogenase NAD-binding domain-containing protein n=1 Tax=Sporolactobacillus sp. Y61 TaxID=3160863 RepID=A0AAU8ICD3_9BACL
MTRTIRKAAVIGSGVMGSGIAAHLANAGIPCLLLDIVPDRLTAKEAAGGLTLNDPQVRNRLATAAITGLKRAKPAPLYDSELARLITPGNLEDHLDQLKEVDWIIEVIVENLSIKKELLAKIETVWQPGTIVSSNTSGISINEMAAGRSLAFRQHFSGTHFFNPPRYLKLLEIIPGKETDPKIVAAISAFCEKTLGKGIVMAKDTPNFIANRIGTYGLLVTLQEMTEKGYSVDEVDAVTGPVLGRPRSATLRTLDVVGIDTFMHVARNVYGHVTDEAEKAVFTIPAFIQEMVSKGWIGAKVGQGFYKKVMTEKGKAILALDLETMTYQPRKKVVSMDLAEAKEAGEMANRIKTLVYGEDRYAQLAWNVTRKVLLYAAEKAGEISDSIVDIDRAMKWGFNWALGPFEIWDAIGLKTSVQRMEQEGDAPPEWVLAWIEAGHDSFYRRKNGHIEHFSQTSGVITGADSAEFKKVPLKTIGVQRYMRMETRPDQISLQSLKGQNKVILANKGASVIDLGDDVACLEFHSPNNAINDDVLSMIDRSLEEVRNHFKGLVIAGEGKHFCVGANILQLLTHAFRKNWSAIDQMTRTFQNTLMRLKYFEKPVVIAPHQMTLGGGLEVCLAADQVNPAAETYAGLVEVGVGLIPAGGGTKEMALRASRRIKGYPRADLQPFVLKAFEMIGTAKVSSSAHEAQKFGWFRETDRVIINSDNRIYEAKQTVLSLVATGYRPPQEEKVTVIGEDGKALLLLAADNMRRSGYASEYDRVIAGKLAHVLSGGDVPAGSCVTEQYLLDLEREAFLSLCGEAKTQARIQHMLTRGKPLRN